MADQNKIRYPTKTYRLAPSTSKALEDIKKEEQLSWNVLFQKLITNYKTYENKNSAS